MEKKCAACGKSLKEGEYEERIVKNRAGFYCKETDDCYVRMIENMTDEEIKAFEEARKDQDFGKLAAENDILDK
jgi:hypothetical protein